MLRASPQSIKISGVARCLQHLLVLRRYSRCLARLLLRLDAYHLLLVEREALDLPLLLEALDQILVLPANLLRQVAELATAALGLQAEHLQAAREHHALLLVVGVRDALEALQPVKRSSSTSGLVRDHAADATPEDLGRSAEVVHPPSGVGVHVLPLEVGVLELVPVQRTRDLDVLSADAYDVLTVQQLLGKSGSQAPEQVATAVHNDLLLERHR
mmetsp:Transcript_36410/g.73412  ORF Transcript_36410/g.73412 Transcript_36410/m.73412 type:complete len:215 (+) Transcript_36410:136-780(+)